MEEVTDWVVSLSCWSEMRILVPVLIYKKDIRVSRLYSRYHNYSLYKPETETKDRVSWGLEPLKDSLSLQKTIQILKVKLVWT